MVLYEWVKDYESNAWHLHTLYFIPKQILKNKKHFAFVVC